MAATIRPALFPADKPVAIRFIDGLQRYERQYEPNRRIDATVAAEFFDILMADVAKNRGIVHIAQDGDRAVGWAVAWPELDDAYVVSDERQFVYISELYVVEAARGTGVGRALIAACEDFARSLGIRIVQIGVLPGNTRAASVYAGAGYLTCAMRLRKYLQ
jgi:GNAT superfamily N-acetyltransferase